MHQPRFSQRERSSLKQFFSTDFFVPPPQFPSPCLQPWLTVSEGQLRAIERLVVTTINAVLLQYKLPPIKGVAELFDITDKTLLGLPELDHYPQHPHANNPLFDAICSVLRNMSQLTLVFCPDGQDTELARTPAPHIVVTHCPVNLAQAVQETDVAITYGNIGTSTNFLLAGVSLHIIPVSLEQYLVAKHMVDLGVAII